MACFSGLRSEATKKAIIVIDLDTVMPGLVAHDFGDAVRFAANFTEEDSEDTNKTGVDLNVFWAFADGFLSKTTGMLTRNEIDTLGMSGFVLACELAKCFLDDYITGDKYFKVKKDNHNIIRTRCQIALAKDMYKKLNALDYKFPAVSIRTSTERPEAMDKGVFTIGSITTEQVLQAVELAVSMHLNGDDAADVPAYTDSNVSAKVIKIIQSYTGIINKMIWKK